MSYQDISDLIPFFVFQVTPPPLHCPALSQHSYLYLTSEMKPSVFQFQPPIKNQPKPSLGFGGVSLDFGKSPLFAEGSCRCPGAEAGLPGWHTHAGVLHKG